LNKFLGIAILALGLAIAIVPNFTDCPTSMSMGGMAAKVPPCHASSTAEIYAGAPLAIIGGVMVFTKRKSGFLTLSILGVVLGAAAIALPHIVGTCKSPTMICNTTMKPAVTLLGSLGIAGSLGGLVLIRKAR
jgi:hypothetical protein